MSLWQKPDSEPSTEKSFTRSPQAAPPASTGSGQRGAGTANIGQSVRIHGELSGNEDLTVNGRIQGKILLKDHNLTIGPNGHVTAEVHAKCVTVNGAVVGNITAGDKVEIATSGSVEGDISAPRVALADGSSFKGSIDMGSKASSSTGSGSSVGSRDVAMAASAAKS